MCCILPCVRWLQLRYNHLGRRDICTIVVTEIVRWVTMIIPLYLSVWRYGELRGYKTAMPIITEVWQFWAIVTAGILGASLFFYLPLKIIYVRYWYHRGTSAATAIGWRPSLLFYIFLCALPCMVLLLVAAKSSNIHDPKCVMDPPSIMILQATVMGLTVTEWMAKIKEEELTYDLIAVMSIDFFFAYDVIELLMMATSEQDVYESVWVYVSFAFAFIAMFKYVPAVPTNIDPRTHAPKGAFVSIVVSMFTNDIPFVIIRLCTMIKFGYCVSDLVHPIKNVALILFGSTQLYIIWKNFKTYKKEKLLEYSEHRVARYPDVIDNSINPSDVQNEPADAEQQLEDAVETKQVEEEVLRLTPLLTVKGAARKWKRIKDLAMEKKRSEGEINAVTEIEEIGPTAETPNVKEPSNSNSNKNNNNSIATNGYIAEDNVIIQRL